MAAYARQAKDTELIKTATEIKVRAERRFGEMLATTARNKGIAASSERSSAGRTLRPADSTPTLSELGVTKSDSSR
jgi:hypothetical protein